MGKEIEIKYTHAEAERHIQRVIMALQAETSLDLDTIIASVGLVVGVAISREKQVQRAQELLRYVVHGIPLQVAELAVGQDWFLEDYKKIGKHWTPKSDIAGSV